MQLAILNTLMTLTLAVSAHPNLSQYDARQIANTTEVGVWMPAQPGDFRGPCPMMNTLANHGFIPRDGRNITLQVAIDALGGALSFEETTSIAQWRHGVKANPLGGNASDFTLKDLQTHGIVEHDASMSRPDAFFGNSSVFNQTVFDTTKAFWTADNTTIPMLARGSFQRQIQSIAFNPEYTFNSSSESISRGAVSNMLLVFGDFYSGTVNRTFLTSFFENEKLPTEFGWHKRDTNITLTELADMSAKILTAQNTITASDSQLNFARDIFNA